jgi:general secretion pathway protein D
MPKLLLKVAGGDDAKGSGAGAGAPSDTQAGDRGIETSSRERAGAAVTRLEPAARIVRPAPAPERPATSQAEQLATVLDDAPVDVSLPPQPAPQFIDTLFGEVLRMPYSLGPGVAEKREIISLRGSIKTTKQTLFAMAQTALKDYGLSVTIENGAARIVRDDAAGAGAPLLIMSRALPSVPDASRPVIQFFELRSIEANSMVSLLQDAYPDASRIKITARPDINALVLSGAIRDVASAAEVIDQIDQPRLAGAQVVRIEPVYWAADRLADAVIQALQTEGYQAVRTSGVVQRAVNFLIVPYTNQIIVFSNQQDVFDRAMYWIGEFDRPGAFGDQENVFIYTVRNTSAEKLGGLVAAAQTGVAPAQAGAPPATGRVTVDMIGNRLLFRGTPSEFRRWRDLVAELDVPPQQVLVEMTIAEVTLTDETRFGVEWALRTTYEGGALRGGTLGGVGLGTSGLQLSFNKPDLQAALNAFASNNNVNILSTPRLVALSGSTARIQVGTDVPVITSQRASNTQQSGATDVLQTIQYRQTGVILEVTPVVYGEDRIDLQISQEVSSQQANPNQAIGSPLILNRSVQTQISLREGATGVIGGLIQDNLTRGTTGVPVLKDLPLVGGAFRTDTLESRKTELLVMLTPYVVRGDDITASAKAYAAQLNRSFARRGPNAYTLLPWSPLPRAKVVYGAGVPVLNGRVAPSAPSPAPASTPLPSPSAAPALGGVAPVSPAPAPNASTPPTPEQAAPALRDAAPGAAPRG